MDIRDAVAEKRSMDRLEGMKAPLMAQTPLQQRIVSELEMHAEGAQKRRAGGPDDMTEIDREFTMLEGALEGVYQRVGTLVGVLLPVADEALVARIQSPDARVLNDHFQITSTFGHRLRELHGRINELEDVLSTIVSSVRA